MALVVSACGGSSNSGNAAKQSGNGSQTTASPTIINQLFKTDGPTHGKTYKLGASLTLTGGLTFGKDGLNGLRLAQKEIKAAGGPNFDLQVQDDALDPAKGVTTARQFVSDGIGVQITGASAILGSQLPIMAQSHLLSFDPSAGVGVFASKPYFWGAKGETPNGPWIGLAKYIQQKLPNARRVVMTTGGTGAISDTQLKQLKDSLKGTQLQVVGTELYKQGTSDFANVIQRINSHKPDVIMLIAYATDPAQFMKTYVASGGHAQVISSDFTTQAAQVGGSAMNGLWFSQDNFLPEYPTNDWAKYFVSEYQKAYGTPPTIYAASYYDTLFVVWQLMDKTLAGGGNPENGQDMQKTLMSNLGPYPSVVGVGGQSGQISFDPSTHALSTRGYMVGEVQNGKPIPLAYFNGDGSGFQLAKQP